jgi:hypothetical protein
LSYNQFEWQAKQPAEVDDADRQRSVTLFHYHSVICHQASYLGTGLLQSNQRPMLVLERYYQALNFFNKCLISFGKSNKIGTSIQRFGASNRLLETQTNPRFVTAAHSPRVVKSLLRRVKGYGTAAGAVTGRYAGVVCFNH